MINFAKFEIIGRIGEIDARPKVTLLSVCANYRRKGDDNEWQEHSHWNRVSLQRRPAEAYRRPGSSRGSRDGRPARLVLGPRVVVIFSDGSRQEIAAERLCAASEGRPDAAML